MLWFQSSQLRVTTALKAQWLAGNSEKSCGNREIGGMTVLLLSSPVFPVRG